MENQKALLDFKNFFGKNIIPKKNNNVLELETNKLPPLIKEMIEAIELKDENIPYSIILNAVNSVIANLVANRKVKVEVEDYFKTYCNYYGIVFADSGVGKDRVFTEIENEVLRDSVKLLKGVIQDRYEHLLAIATKEDDGEDEKKGKKNKKDKEQKIIKKIPYVISNGTIEGICNYREHLSDYGIGATYTKISEFGDYITSTSNYRSEFLSGITELFDGKFSPKATVYNPNPREIEDVPSSFFAHTSISNLGNDAIAMQKMNSFFGRGLARRCFLTFAKQEDYRTPKYSNLEDLYSDFKANIKKAKAKYKELNSKTITIFKALFENAEHREIVFNPEEIAFDIKDMGKKQEIGEYLIYGDETIAKYFKFYESYCKARALNCKNENIKNELSGRPWKVIKLAGVYSILNHQHSKTVEVEDFLQACYVAEYFGEQAHSYFGQGAVQDFEKLAEYIIEQGEASKTQIAKHFGYNKNNFSTWLKANLELAIEEAQNRGYDMKLVKGKGNTQLLRATQLAIKEDIEPTKVNCSLSISDHMTMGFEAIDITFDKLPTIMRQNNKHYSASRFIGNYRNSSNWTGSIDTVFLDIDDGTTIEQAKKELEIKGLMSWIVPTKSHQKEKNGVVCDRFRVAIMLNKPFDMEKDYHKELLKNIGKYLNFNIDKNALDVTRFFYGANSEVEPIFISGGLLEWQDELYPTIKKVNKERFFALDDGSFTANSGLGKSIKEDIAKVYAVFGEPQSIGKGGRSNYLWRCAYILAVDESVNWNQLEYVVNHLNDNLESPISSRDLQTTILEQARKFHIEPKEITIEEVNELLGLEPKNEPTGMEFSFDMKRETKDNEIKIEIPSIF